MNKNPSDSSFILHPSSFIIRHSMVIKFHCPHCKRALSVKDHLAGKKAGCPACKQLLVIPGGPSPAGPASSPVPAPAPAGANIERSAAAALSETQQERSAQAAQTIDFNCPQCDEPVSFPPEEAGHQSPCPHCRRIIKVPIPKTKVPGDWRRIDASIPTGARQDTEPAPEGAWGTSSSTRIVSREALEEAEVIPIRRIPLTRRQKVNRVSLLAVVLLSVGLFAWWATAAWQHNRRDRFVTRAVDAIQKAAAEDAKTRTSVAEIHRAAGLYFLRTGKPDTATLALAHFNQAREYLVHSQPGPERDLLLADLALTQVELGGSGADVDQDRKRKWEDVHRDLRQTLSHLTTSGGRLHALRLLTRKLAGADQAAAAAGLATHLANAGRSPEAAADVWSLSYEAPELLSAIGLELARAGNSDPANRLRDLALTHYSAPPPGKPPLPLAPSLVALCVVLEKPPPLRKGKAEEDPAILLLGSAEGLAQKNNLGDARKLLSGTPSDLRSRLLVAIASGATDGSTLDAILALPPGAIASGRVSPWSLHRLVLQAHDAGAGDRASALANLIEEPTLRGRAQLDALAPPYGAAAGSTPDLSQILGSDKPLLRGLAHERQARGEAFRDSGTVKTVETWDELVRPFGLVGAALGLQDRDQPR